MNDIEKAREKREALKEYELMRACYLSGQMDEREWQGYLYRIRTTQ